MTPAKTNRPTLADLATMSPDAALLLSVDELSLLADEAKAIEDAGKAAKAAVLAVSRQKYEAVLAGHQFGSKRIGAGEMDVVFNVPKNVAWDNDALAAVEAETDQWGKPLWSYMDAKRTVTETAYDKLPADVKAKFTAARTVKPGAMTVKFEPAKVAA